LDEMKS